MRAAMILIGLGLVLGLPTNVQAVEPDVKCYSAKVKETAKYYACRLKAESKAIKKGETPDFSKCDSKYSQKWQKVESKAGGACPTEGDEAAIQAKMIGDSDTIVARLSGVRFVDNGDGTVTDNQTGLMWEKKTGTVTVGPTVFCDFNPDSGGTCSDLHNVRNVYDWDERMGEWLSRVNGATDDPDVQAGLGGHTDWRLPTIVELQTLLLEPFLCGTTPCIDSIFGPTAVSNFYWSSTSSANLPSTAWFVDFSSGFVNNQDKSFNFFVRAVRGGL